MTRGVAPTLPDLLTELAGGSDWRLEPLGKHVDSLSGSPFETAHVRGETYVVKHIARDLDWLMRVLGDGAAGTRPRALIVWQEGLVDALPAEIDDPTVGMAYDPTTGHAVQVMRDIGATLVPAGSSTVPLAQHRGFLDHLAALHATFWGFRDTCGLTMPEQRYGFAHPDHSAREAAAGHHDVIPSLFPSGWQAVCAAWPAAGAAGLALAADPTPLALAMAGDPTTLVHGDWKFGNLGSHPDGRTVLLDWGWPGQAGPAVDLAWYLAVNCDRLPESKEDSIDAYRTALEKRGTVTAPWWDRHLRLALLGGFLQLGWSKTGDELAWWAERAERTVTEYDLT